MCVCSVLCVLCFLFDARIVGPLPCFLICFLRSQIIAVRVSCVIAAVVVDVLLLFIINVAAALGVCERGAYDVCCVLLSVRLVPASFLLLLLLVLCSHRMKAFCHIHESHVFPHTRPSLMQRILQHDLVASKI